MARTAREDNLALRGALIVELPAGAAVAANDALYLDSNGKVQKLTSAQEDDRIGVAQNAAALDETVRVQIAGKCACVADAAISIGDRIGAPSTTAGRVATAANTLAVASGGTTVTSSSANGAIVTGDPVVSRVLGVALTAAASAGDSITVLLTL
ncbi:MAG: DUF2190 family protein [Acidobacteria bacterium]|nr:hypothetical protein [Acidobacteriota bacterium]MCZ6489091.1 DUF2190 family protein [Acidobacteriota bacterium]MCZ6751306.1 DUF2190 family protein [Acidobacteriota bacterium]